MDRGPAVIVALGVAVFVAVIAVVLHPRRQGPAAAKTPPAAQATPAPRPPPARATPSAPPPAAPTPPRRAAPHPAPPTPPPPSTTGRRSIPEVLREGHSWRSLGTPWADVPVYDEENSALFVDDPGPFGKAFRQGVARDPAIQRQLHRCLRGFTPPGADTFVQLAIDANVETGEHAFYVRDVTVSIEGADDASVDDCLAAAFQNRTLDQSGIPADQRRRILIHLRVDLPP